MIATLFIEGDGFRVVGPNAVYILDGRSVSYTNISEAAAERTMSMFNVHLHILSEGDTFDLLTHQPIPCPAAPPVES